ncbi:hypothetical protein [Bacillus marasmi]|uniref:hypothetical protein n=1 Tax=Bacillus marasmi TaxID=1926279 RepID=UPI0011CC16E4|nr:hypothetical protein [Bacillus marasmi]
MAITEIEQRIFEDKIQKLNNMNLEEWASDSFADKQFRLIFIKAIHNLVQDEFKSNDKLSEASLLDNIDIAKSTLEELLLSMVKVASAPRKNKIYKYKLPKQELVKGYTTGQLATYFGVSTTSINNWIHEGRFLIELPDGTMEKIVRKNSHEKVKIHPETWYDAPSGTRYQVKEVIQAYEYDVAEWEKSRSVNTVTEEEQIRLYLKHFKEKYNGEDFQAVFGDRDWDQLSAQEEADAAMWSFFLQRIRSEDSRD